MVEGIPLAAMDRILRKAGATRVSTGGKKALKKALEDVAEEYAAKAWAFAKHAGRSTIKAEDVQLAIK